jgi:hypothetical protein
MDSNKKYFSTGYLKAKPGKVDLDKGIINNVKVCTAGEALGHGVNLDSEFIANVTRFGNEKKQGLKARFGHPSMCSTSLGTFLGRFKNFRTEKTIRDDGAEADVSIADLYLSNEAKNTPNGNLHSYVCGMAANEADMFGTSIVYEPGEEYKKDKDGNKYYSYIRQTRDGFEKYYRDIDGEEENKAEEDLSEETFVEINSLFACDCVDEPAANDGMFSGFSNETVAGQISSFLDTNPEIVATLSENPEVIKAISKYGKNIDGFFARYQEYKKMEALKMKEPKTALNSDEPKDIDPVSQPAANPEADVPEAEPAAAPVEPAEPAAPVAQKAKPIDKTEFGSLVKTFGADIAAKVTLSGGGIAEAHALKAQSDAVRIKELETENAELCTKLAAAGGVPAKFSGEVKTKKTVWDN